MSSSPIFFFFKLMITLVIIFLIHISIFHYLEISIYSNYIIGAYISNFVLTFLSYLFLYKFRVKLAHSLGFLFLGGSMLKFTVFFIVFLPFYKSDGDMTKLEFSTFFIPFAVSLFLETISFIKVLKD